MLRNLFIKIINILKRIYFFGNKYHCYFCNKRARKFISYGSFNNTIKEYQIQSMGRRDNCICPNCHSKDRERFVHLFILNLINKNIINKKSKILHFSPEQNLRNYFINSKFENYSTSDFLSKNNNLQIDLEKEFKIDKKFDLIICNHVLEHIRNDDIALKNIFSYLEKKGCAILQTPYSKIINEDYINPTVKTDKDRLNFYGQEDHVRIYSKKSLIQKIKKTGFEIRTFKLEDFFPQNENIGLIKDEEILFAKK